MDDKMKRNTTRRGGGVGVGGWGGGDVITLIKDIQLRKKTTKKEKGG